MSLSTVKRRANPLAQRLALLGETTITTPVSNVVTTPVVDLEGLQELIAQCVFVYGSGGERADFFVQTSFDNGTTWQDVAAFRFPGVTGRTATDLDGSSDYYTRGADLTGSADGKLGLFSCWFRTDGGDGTSRYFLMDQGTRFYVLHVNTNVLRVVGRRANGTTTLQQDSTTTYIADTTWYHVLLSYDLANAKAFIYVDDASVGDTPSTLDDNEIDYTRTDWAVGAANTGALPFNGAIAELFFAQEYLDISNEDNRRLFRSAAGHPVPLGADGSTPTGTQPIIYAIDGDMTNNLGSGGNFTAQGSPTSVAGPNVEDTRFQAIKTAIATAANQSNSDGALDPNSIIDGVLGDRLRVKYSTLGVFAGGTSIKIDAICRG